MYTFRRATKKDFTIVSTLPQDKQELFYMSPSAVSPLTAEQVEKIAETRWQPTVVLDGDRVAGYANLYGLEPGRHCWLGNVIVDAEYRGKGAAKALITEMLRIAGVELKVPKMLLVCHNTNLTGLFFYYKLGFKPFDLHPMKNYTGEAIMGIKMELATDHNSA